MGEMEECEFKDRLDGRVFEDEFREKVKGWLALLLGLLAGCWSWMRTAERAKRMRRFIIANWRSRNHGDAVSKNGKNPTGIPERAFVIPCILLLEMSSGRDVN